MNATLLIPLVVMLGQMKERQAPKAHDVDVNAQSEVQSSHDLDGTVLNRTEGDERLTVPDAIADYEVLPQHVLCTTPACLYGSGWGEAGNEGRSVRFVNSYNPYRRYYLRVFIDGEEAVLMDGVGVLETLVETRNGPHPTSLLGPNGEGQALVNVGEHRLVIERYLGPVPFQYKDTCVWNVDFDRNLDVGGQYYFWGGACSKIGQSPLN